VRRRDRTAARRFAAVQDLAALSARRLQSPLGNRSPRLVVDQRAHQGLGVQRIADACTDS
jgi:hypothetical protein